MTKLCGFGKRASHPTSSAQPAPLILPVWPYPAEFSQAGDQSATHRWDFHVLFSMEAFAQEPERWGLGCVATFQGCGPLLLPQQTQLHCPKKGKKGLPLSYRLAGTTLNKRLFGSVLPSPCWAEIQGGERRTAQSWDLQRVSHSKAMVWNWDKVLSPLLQTGLALPSMGNSFDLTP